ncbi:hypothetical protein LA5095_02719 [Roseibium album]|uniref:Uncharacterized protein n=1 Tax=Roseibium album TaxID=311410 RepID=A0A0M6ZN98_9HYPH|nr:hypothetical protein LA5094_01665 [Roseibium album]CTQ63646.1 hypothetical protein LA5096_00088 [Roseibium album]CTQ73239.1 hypothetical protein LA5095_02719 [Roseibium album]
MFCYFVVTPDFGDNGKCILSDHNAKKMIIFCKFGITKDGDLDAVRSGYRTHNPTFRFLKFQFNENIVGQQITVGAQGGQTFTFTKDLGKDLQKILLSGPFGQVGNTEWMCTDNINFTINVFDYLLKNFDVNHKIISKDNVQEFGRNIFNFGRRGAAPL